MYHQAKRDKRQMRKTKPMTVRRKMMKRGKRK